MTPQELFSLASLFAGIVPIWDLLWFNFTTWFNLKNMEIAAQYE